jgi:protein ImuA
MAKHATAQERLLALRETIAKLEGKTPTLVAEEQPQGERVAATGKGSRRIALEVDELDAALEGGLPLDGMTEIRTCAMRNAGAGSGFVLALAALIQRQAKGSALLWISDRFSNVEAGLPYPIGLAQYGLQVRHFLHALPRKLEDALWLAETAAASGALAATILEIRGNPSAFGLSESRRLNLRAKAARRPILLLRHAGEEEASSAVFRFHAEPGPAAERVLPSGTMLGGSIGSPVFRLTLEKSRNPAPLSFLLEWNSRDRQFCLARQPEPSRLAGDGTAHSGPRLPASADGSDRAAALGRLLAFDRAS